MSKRPFYLLEILIALTLVSLCAIPLIRPHFILAKKDIEAANSIQNQMAANRQFELIREKFYTGKIPWKRRKTQTIDNCTISIKSQYNKGKGLNYRTYRLYNIEVDVNGKIYTYNLFAERVRQ